MVFASSIAHLCPSMTSIHVLLVDDNAAFLNSALHLLAVDERCNVIGQAISGRDALEKTKLLCPDVVVMDLAMPEMNGLEATRQIKRCSKSPYVIILTLYDSPEYRTAVQLAGADGFVAKSEVGVALLPLIYALLE